MDIFGNSTVDNSVFTPEFNQGQANNTTDAQGETAPVTGQAAETNTNVDNNVGDTVPADGQAAEPIVVGNKTFNSVDDLIAAYTTLDTSYANIRKDYTKKAQELSLRKRQDMSNNRMTYNQPQQQQMYQQYQQPNYSGIQYQMNDNYLAAQQQQSIMQGMMQGVDNQLAMNQAMIQMSADNALNEIKASDAEFDEVAPELWDLIDTDPYFSNIQFNSPDMVKNTINMAYNMAKQKVENAKSNIQINNAKAEAYKSKRSKVVNNDNSNVAVRRESNAKAPQDDVKNSIINIKPTRF